MPLTMQEGRVASWSVRHVAVVGPGIVGMPMAALLAHAAIREGSDEPALVTVVQRNSPTSGWKVDAINSGRSPIGGVEPDLDRLVRESVAQGRLRASHDYAALRDADMVLVAVQTDKAGLAPDYGPLYEAIDGIATALRDRPAGNVPVVVFESTVAPSSMTSVIRERFARQGLVEGRDVLLGNSPNRVMPGRLVERVRASDKIVAGLHPDTPGLIQRVYRHIVTEGALHPTNSMTAEIVKTAEVCRWCDARDVDFFGLRDRVNAQLGQEDAASSNSQAVPSGGLLVPMLGVGGHCLPKDGILLWWRALEAGVDSSRSLILGARAVNDEQPAHALALAEGRLGSFRGRRVALLGAAYRGNSEDTRNAPTLALAGLLRDRGIAFTIHDPYVHERDANLRAHGLTGVFTRDLGAAVRDAEVVVLCTPHRVYLDQWEEIRALAPRAVAVFDTAHLVGPEDAGLQHAGIGRGRAAPDAALVEAVLAGFRAVEAAVADEVAQLCEWLNRHYAVGEFNRVEFGEVRRIAATCPTGCAIVEQGRARTVAGFASGLVERAAIRSPAGTT